MESRIKAKYLAQCPKTDSEIKTVRKTQKEIISRDIVSRGTPFSRTAVSESSGFRAATLGNTGLEVIIASP